MGGLLYIEEIHWVVVQSAAAPSLKSPPKSKILGETLKNIFCDYLQIVAGWVECNEAQQN